MTADGQPQSCSLAFGTVRPHLLEAFKDSLLILLRNPYASISHPEGKVRFFFSIHSLLGLQCNSASIGRKFESIGKQVSQYHFEICPVYRILATFQFRL